MTRSATSAGDPILPDCELIRVRVSALKQLSVHLDRPVGLPNEAAEPGDAIHEFFRHRVVMNFQGEAEGVNVEKLLPLNERR